MSVCTFGLCLDFIADPVGDFKNVWKNDQELFQYDDADRNIRNTIFDSPFTSEEIVKGTALLKSKKASGYDSISNEMIKASLPFSLSFLVTLFNKILQTQMYPEGCSRGIITPVPKLREIENLDNYHSIAINSKAAL